MAFSYGFFNSKGLDRTYTAENFCDYLGSIICNGILDTYGQKFHLRAGTGLSVILGTGKAWINGHYFINDAAYNIDLSNYMDESLSRYVGIAIVLNTADSVRNVSIEVTPGTPAENPGLPSYPSDANKTRLLMYAVRMNPGATSLTDRDWYDYREDKNVCGYCQCILGRCQVSELLFQMNTIKGFIREYNKTVADLTDKVEYLQLKVDDLTGDIIATGSVGDDVYYVLYSNGNLLLRGTGATYDYQLNGNRSPFFEDERIKRVVISDGITSIGDVFFERCQNLTDIVLPDSLESIGERAFFMYGSGGLTSLRIPSSVTTIKEKAFVDDSMTSVTLPASLKTLGTYIFMECEHLQSARVECEEVPGFCFVRCTALTELTLSKNVKRLCSHMVNYCQSLQELQYEGTLDEWSQVTKQNNWDGNTGLSGDILERVICTDGYMEYNHETHEWDEVRT